GSQRRLEAAKGLDLLMGEGHFVSQKTLEVRLLSGELRRLSAEKIFINVGARPAIPPIEGIDSVPFLNSTTIMELDTVPEHLLVLGGGYVGLEFAQMFRRFGSLVTVVQRGAQLLSREDADIAENLTELLREDGIDVLLKTAAIRSVAPATGGIEL